MHADIMKVSQDFNLETQQMENFLVLSLPTGRLIRVAVTEAVAQDVINAAAGGGGIVHSPATQTSLLDQVPEFGGDYVPEATSRRSFTQEPLQAPIPESYGYGRVDPGEQVINPDENGVGSF